MEVVFLRPKFSTLPALGNNKAHNLLEIQEQNRTLRDIQCI